MMKPVISFIKKYRHLFVFAAFAALFGAAAFSVCVQGEDYIVAAKSGESFASALSYAARDLSEGFAAALLHVAFIKLPAFFARAIGFIAVLLTAALLAAVAAGRGKHGRLVDPRRFPAALIFASAFFAALPYSSLRFAVLCFGGISCYVIPCALILLYKFLGDRPGRAWILPVVSLAAALFSYQAALAVCALAALDAAYLAIRGERFALRVLCAVLSLCAFAAHLFTGCVPSFPEGVSKFWALHSFVASILDHGGFFLVLLIACVFAAAAAIRRIGADRREKSGTFERVFHIAFCALSVLTAIALVLYFQVFALVAIPGSVVAALAALTFVCAALYFSLSFISGEDGASAPLAAAALCSLAVTLATGTFGGKSYYIPLILSGVVLARLFLEARETRPACAAAGLLCAVFIAATDLSAAHFIAAAALCAAVALVSLSPFFRRLRFLETLAVCAAFLALFTVGRGYIAAAGVKAKNAEAIAAYDAASGETLTLAAPADVKYGFPDSLLGDEGVDAFRAYYGLPDDAPIEFAAPQNGE